MNKAIPILLIAAFVLLPAGGIGYGLITLGLAIDVACFFGVCWVLLCGVGFLAAAWDH